ncbi:TetR/AcrR family transcriptional regulator [Microvirga pudoricolor]|uniref:TetR/AcrR family transcriptional regulator n=1 Tax=Microvirga pudoricolor TaxID=2778729 RepID=UPI00194EFBC2|nr:TetR family transcriptional regulator [Microvirga pudoricolor]MBM6594226.1 TetR family transcriptional regulator [Microvirga pudoricolor]
MSSQDSKERVRQKQRTRNALLAAARELLTSGRQPTVSEVADHAGISRATAYRYYSAPEVLAQEAILDAVAAQFEGLAAGMTRGDDPARNAEDLVAAVLRMVLANEALFRTFLTLASAGDGRPTRGGRRVRWIGAALEPLASRLLPGDFDRLVNALSLLAGIETVVVLKDVCGLDPDAMENTVRWMTRALVAQALEAG